MRFNGREGESYYHHIVSNYGHSLMDRVVLLADACEREMGTRRNLQDPSISEPSVSILTSAFLQAGLEACILPKIVEILSRAWWYGERLQSRTYTYQQGWLDELHMLIPLEVEALCEKYGGLGRVLWRYGWTVPESNHHWIGANHYQQYLFAPKLESRLMGRLFSLVRTPDLVKETDTFFSCSLVSPLSGKGIIPKWSENSEPWVVFADQDNGKAGIIKTMGEVGIIPSRPRILKAKEGELEDKKELDVAMEEGNYLYVQNDEGEIKAWFKDMPELKTTGWTENRLKEILQFFQSLQSG